MNRGETLEDKQAYLRSNIDMDDYQQFFQFCQNVIQSTDISKWSMEQVGQVINKFKRQKERKAELMKKLVKYTYNDYQSRPNKSSSMNDEESQMSQCPSSRIDSVSATEIKSQVAETKKAAINNQQKKTTNQATIRSSFQQKPNTPTNNNNIKNNSTVSFQQFQFWTSSVPSNTKTNSSQIRNKSTSQYRTNKPLVTGASTPPTTKNTYHMPTQPFNINVKPDPTAEQRSINKEPNKDYFDILSFVTPPATTTNKSSPYLKKQNTDAPYQLQKNPTGTIKLKQVKELRQSHQRGLSVNNDKKNIGLSLSQVILKQSVPCHISLMRNKISDRSLEVSIGSHLIVERKFLAADYAMYSMNVLSSGQISIQRNYEDFSKLKENLQKIYPGIHLPYLQPTSWLSGTNIDFINNQKRMLQFFIRDLIRNKQIRNSVIMQQFLTLSDHKSIKRKFQKYQKLSEPKGLHELCLLQGQVKVQLSSEQTKYIQNLQNFIRKMGELYQRHQKLTVNLVEQYGQIMKTLKSIDGLMLQIQKQIKQFNTKASSNTIKYLGNAIKTVRQTYFQDYKNTNFNHEIQSKQILPFLRYEKKNFMELQNLISAQKKIKKAYDKKLLSEKSTNLQFYNSQSVKDLKNGILEESSNVTVLKYHAGYLGYQARHQGQRVFDELAVKTFIRWKKMYGVYINKLNQNVKYWESLNKIQKQKFYTQLTF